MSFGPSQQQNQADAYQTQYQGNLQASQQQGQRVIDFGLGQYEQNRDFQQSAMGGQNFAKLYASQLGGLEHTNSTMNSIAQRLSNFDVGSLNQGSVENLALQNQAMEGAMGSDLASRGLSGNGGTGLAALMSLRSSNQKGYADQLRANQLAGTQALGMAGQLQGQIGANQQNLLSLFGNLDVQRGNLAHQGVNAMMNLGGNLYGGAQQGMGNLNQGLQQGAAQNAQGQGNMFGGLIQGGLGLAGTLLGGPIGGAIGGALGGMFTGGGGGHSSGTNPNFGVRYPQ